MKAAEQDSIRRAISHHSLVTKLIEFDSPPGQGQPRWRFKLRGQDEYLDLTWRETKVMCIALATVETLRPPVILEIEVLDQKGKE